jgi:hypothetical protein
MKEEMGRTPAFEAEGRSLRMEVDFGRKFDDEGEEEEDGAEEFDFPSVSFPSTFPKDETFKSDIEFESSAIILSLLFRY